MDEPTAAEIKVFVDAVEELAAFEGMQLLNRGYGCLPKEPRPIPEFVRVINWLRGKTL